MNPLKGKTLINGAPSQYDRWLEALDDGYVKVDGRSFPELMEFSVEFGKLINFYDLEDRIDGDWSNFFATDQAAIVSLLGAWDVRGLEAEYQRYKDIVSGMQDAGERLDGLRGVFGFILSIALSINELIRACMSHAGSGMIAVLLEELESCVKNRLRGQIRLLCAYDEGAGAEDALGETIGLDYSHLLPIWGVSKALSDSSIYQGEPRLRKIDNALSQLDSLFDEFIACMSNLKGMVGDGIQGDPISEDVRPQIALYIAFLKLFRHAQDSLNTLSKRYREFYYHGILKEPSKGLVPDSVYLSLSLEDDEAITQVEVPEATLFQAVQEEDGEDILYASDRALTVTQAQIGQIKTLRVLHGDLLGDSGDNDRGRNQGESIQVTKRIIQADVSIEEFSPETPWASFGEARSLDTPRVVSEPATLGFAIASSCLFLQGGERKIDLELELPAQYVRQTLLPVLEALARATGIGVSDILATMLQNGLQIYMSTSEGWLGVDSFEAEIGPGVHEDDDKGKGNDFGLESIALCISLPGSAPGIGPLNDTSEEADLAVPDSDTSSDMASNPNPSLPTLKAYLKQDPVRLQGDRGAVEVSPVSVLGSMRFEDIRLEAHVVGLSNLSLENTDGEIDTSSPFALFGANPVQGSYLLIYAGEIFKKTPEHLCIDLKWFALPVNDDGFAGYYKDYVIGPDGKEHDDLLRNSSFLVDIDVRNPGSWRLWEKSRDCPEVPEKAVTEYLFRTRKEDACVSPESPGPICDETYFDNLKTCPSGAPVSEYYDAANSAIRIELTSPPYTFGNDIYAKNVLNSVIEDLPDTDACREQCLCECQSLAFAEAAVANCLSQCLDEEGEQYKQCIRPCLKELLNKLVLALLQCATGCAIEGASASESRKLMAVIEEIRDAVELSDEARVPALDKCLNDLAKTKEDAESDQVSGRTDRCLPILTSMLGVSKCILLCGKSGEGEYKACLLACLEACKETLGNAYKQCLTECMDTCMEVKTPVRYPNEPYLPQLEDLSLSYSAHANVVSSEATDSRALFYHLLPFDGYKEHKLKTEEKAFLFPQFEYMGNAYIGLSELNRPQVLNFLFYLTAGTRFPGDEPSSVGWSMLIDNRWKQIDAHDIRADTTKGLLNTGITSLMLYDTGKQGNTVLSNEYAWLRIAVGNDPGSYPMTSGIYSHVLVATRQVESDEAEGSMTLPANSISESVQALAGISSIQQPVASFGGRRRESGSEYVTRLGERLRHKDRAILAWDYERLVLERFPQIWKVQALPGRNATRSNLPGSVLIVVVAGDNSEEVMDPTVPAASPKLLEGIKSHLEERASPFVDISVVNPLYVRIKVVATVKIRNAELVGDRLKELNQSLVAYLSPWFYSLGRARKGAFYASESEINSFINEQSYVEGVDSIAFLYDPDPSQVDWGWCFVTSAVSHELSSVDEARLIEFT